MKDSRNSTRPVGDPIYTGEKVEVELVGSWRDGRPYGFVNSNKVLINDADGYCQPGDTIDAVLSETVEDGVFLADFADYKACFLDEYVDNEKLPVRAVITGRNRYDFRDAVSLPWRMENGGVYGVPLFIKKAKTEIGAEKSIFIHNLRKGKKGNYLLDGKPASKSDMINRANTFHVMETMIESYEPDYSILRNVHGIPNDIFAAVFLGGEKDNFIVSKTRTSKFPDAVKAIDYYLNMLSRHQFATKLLLSWYPDELEQAKKFIEYYYGMEVDHVKESDF
jgi:hypothetical protein